MSYTNPQMKASILVILPIPQWNREVAQSILVASLVALFHSCNTEVKQSTNTPLLKGAWRAIINSQPRKIKTARAQQLVFELGNILFQHTLISRRNCKEPLQPSSGGENTARAETIAQTFCSTSIRSFGILLLLFSLSSLESLSTSLPSFLLKTASRDSDPAASARSASCSMPNSCPSFSGPSKVKMIT